MQLTIHIYGDKETAAKVIKGTDDTKMIVGFQKIEDMLGEQPDLLPRTVYLRDLKLEDEPEWKAPAEAYVADVYRNGNDEVWIVKSKI